MKKQYFVLLIMVIAFFGCNDDDNSEGIKLSKYSIMLHDGKPYEIININKGSGEYAVSTSDSKVTRAEVKDNRLYIVGSKRGDAVITITDKDQHTAKVNVNVNTIDYINHAHLVFGTYVKKGETVALPYSYSEDNFVLENTDETVVKTTIKDGEILVEGLKEGKTDLTAKVQGFYPVWNVEITVLNVYDIVIYRLNQLNEREWLDPTYHYFDIILGNGNYKVESSNENIATTQIISYPEEINPYLERNPVRVLINAKKMGSVTFTVTDQENQSAIANFLFY